MNFNELIEAEIKKQVEERTKDLEISYKNKFEEYKQDLLDKFVMPMYMKLRSFNIEFEKCKNEFDDCAKTFFDKCDEIFNINDDNLDRKEEVDYIDKYFGKTTKKVDLNQKLTPKCDYKECKNYRDGILDDICKDCDSHKIKEDKILKEDKIVKENIKEAKANNEIEISNIKEEPKKKENKQKITNEDIDKFFDTFGDFFKDFGINKDTFKNAKVKVLYDDNSLDNFNKILSEFKDFI